MDSELKFEPTKTWLKEHRCKPVECRNKNCVCIIDKFDGNSQGFCVGYDKSNGDYDIVMVCTITWDKVEKRLIPSGACFHPEEASWLATFINMAVSEMWHFIPEYRKYASSMGRKRRRDIKMTNAEGSGFICSDGEGI